MDASPGDQVSRDTLSPDIENSFFRSWALRARNSEYSSTSDVSPGTRTSKSSPVSPKTPVRPRRRERPNFESRFSEGHVYQTDNGSHQLDVATSADTLPFDALYIAVQERVPTKTRASVDSLTLKAGSNASSIARRAWKLMKRPVHSKTSTTRWDRKPTMPARGGYAWKREVSGHTLEIRIGKKAEPDVKSSSTKSPETPHESYSTPDASYQTDPQPTELASPLKPKSTLKQPMLRSADSSSLEDKPKRSIVTRTKHILGIKSSVILPTPNSNRSRSDSQTGETLHRASSALRDLVDKTKVTPPSDSTSTSNLSVTSIAGRPKHGRALLRPGYHRHHTGHSSSSSVRRVMLGKSPVTTPNEDSMYIGSDAQQYFRVELTEPNAPTYLPSEARRIGTPPLPGNGSKLRGFFFDYNAPRSISRQGEGPWPSEPMNTAPLPHRQRDLTMPHNRAATSPRSPGARLQRDDDDNDWFRVKVAIEEAEDERDRFELNVPEHLPSSPLCPRHPKHKSGGKGVCVYHGRNRTGTDDVVDVGAGWR
ncbi:MAG: hypothetical protein Q9225_007225 [Loekoesia sp. 1 TL-2023]